MGIIRGAYIAITLMVLLTAILSGPLVQKIDLTRQQSETMELGTGGVSLDVNKFPAENVVLRKGDYGSGVYYLKIPPAVVDIHTVEGNPLLVYKIRIPSLQYARSSVSVLVSDMQGSLSVTLATDAISTTRVDQDSYEAELILLVRSEGASRVILERNLTIKVIE